MIFVNTAYNPRVIQFVTVLLGFFDYDVIFIYVPKQKTISNLVHLFKT